MQKKYYTAANVVINNLQVSDSDETDDNETENIQRNEQRLNAEGTSDDDVNVLSVQEEADQDSFQRRCLFDQTASIATSQKSYPLFTR